MGKVIVVTSGKGGVGKTTSSAALGAALAQGGEKVVVVDFDVGLRNLDLVMGAERRVVYDLVNVIQGEAKLTQALIRDKRVETLYLLPASQTRDKDNLTPEGVEKVIAALKKAFRLGHLRQPGRHRARRDAGHAPCRHRHRRHQSGSLLGARFRPHHRPARFQDAQGRERRAHGEAPAAHPLRPGPRRARRHAEGRRRPRDPVDPAARHHPGKHGCAARLQSRLARHAGGRPQRAGAGLFRRGAPAQGRRPCRSPSRAKSASFFGKMFGRKAA